MSCGYITKSFILCQLGWLRWLFFRGFKYKLGFRPRVCQRSKVIAQCIECEWSVAFNLLGGFFIISVGFAMLNVFLWCWFREVFGSLSIMMVFALNAIRKGSAQVWCLMLVIWISYGNYQYKSLMKGLRLGKFFYHFPSVLIWLFSSFQVISLNQFLILSYCFCFGVRMHSFKDVFVRSLKRPVFSGKQWSSYGESIW